MKKLNLSRYPTIGTAITYFQSQYDDRDDYHDLEVDEPLNYFQNQLEDYPENPPDQDTLYNILLKAKANDLKNLCYINKASLEICESRQFWKDKTYSFFFHGDLKHQLQELQLLEDAEIQASDIIEDVSYMIRIKYDHEDYYKNTFINLIDRLMDILKVKDNIEDLLLPMSLHEFKNTIQLLLVKLFYLSTEIVSQNQLNKIYQAILR